VAPLEGAAARLIAYYLPQFHPVPENDEWWGAGFTEWTNVARAKPLFPGHDQPKVPAHLGFYDLRIPEVRQRQADLARDHGIEAFCYWHYWFGNGRTILEKPLQEVLRLGEPDFPFCLGWANESWTGVWYGANDRILIEQKYPGEDDFRAHFDYVLPFMRDPRYLRIEGNPVFLVLRPEQIPDERGFTDLWRRWADEAGLEGIHFIGFREEDWPPSAHGFDGATFSHHNVIRWKLRDATLRRRWQRKLRRMRGQPEHVYSFAESVPYMHGPLHPRETADGEHYPCIVTGWDNTPRSGRSGTVLTDYSPEIFGQHVRHVLDRVRDRPMENRIVFVKSWNEWAEGNFLEPEQRYGLAYLEALREEVMAPTAHAGQVSGSPVAAPPSSRETLGL
jgi:hypothetical protein